jgi:acetoin utilization deacetylase AcuC-like enzyme
MGVSEEGFAAMARQLLALAENYAQARIAFLLEGGYDLAGLKKSVASVLDAMQQPVEFVDGVVKHNESRIEPLVRRIQQVHERYNNLKSY